MKLKNFSIVNFKKTKTHLQNFLNDSTVKNVIKIGHSVSDGVSLFIENPTFFGAAGAVFTTGKALMENFELVSYDYFDDENIWSEPFSRDFNGAIINALKKFPHELLKTHSEGSLINIVDIGCSKIGWIKSQKNGQVYRIYAETKYIDAAREKIRDLLIEKYGGNPIVLRRQAMSARNVEKDRVVLEIDDAIKPLPSELAVKMTAYIKRANEQGINRSMMFYGLPGSGKSTIARQIIKELNYQSFRIKVEDLGSIDVKSIIEALEIFQPDAIIFDDFDRVSRQEQLLELIEYLHKKVKLIVATINDRDALDEALMRPGRFDELVLVDTLDDAVIKNILGDDNIKYFDDVKKWPIVFIQELILRTKFMSNDDAYNSIIELSSRVNRIIESDEDVDNGLLKVNRYNASKDSTEDETEDDDETDDCDDE